MKGLAFIPEMARAALAGTKTNTRRVMVPQPFEWAAHVVTAPCAQLAGYGREGTWLQASGDWRKACGLGGKCEYIAGERRCLLTTWATNPLFDESRPTDVSSLYEDMRPDMRRDFKFWHAGMGEKPAGFGKNRPGRFLPNGLRHLMPVFEIVSVRAERVQDASVQDIVAEGVTYPVTTDDCPPGKAKPVLRVSGKYPPADYMPRLEGSERIDTAKINHEALLRAHWASLWDSINAKRGPGKAKEAYGWKFNVWVWRVEFRRISP